MKIIVTGANGMLGQDLCPILEDEGHEVIETDIDTLDITNEVSVRNILKANMPDIVIHCAAYTNVDKAEEEKDIAFKINGIGTENISKVCKSLGITLFYISTDYVFDGKKKDKYLPEDKPNPINVYGESKLVGEKAVSACDKHYIIRTSWLYGHHGKNFVETMLSLKEEKEIKVVDDQIGCPTWTVELANAIVEIIEEELEYGIYQVCGSGSTSWYNFAKKIFELSNIKANLTPCLTQEFPRPANRPLNSIMDNDGFCRNWDVALKEYLELRC